MARWDPGAEDRLRRAALDLYLERGFENVTAAEIAERAGLARRTFFRYFGDKREVLFAGSERLPPAVAAAVAEAPEGLSPVEVVLHALGDVGVRLAEVGQHARQRRQVIDATPELRERERTKLASVTDALAAALRERGVAAATAALLSRVGTAVFQSAFERWVDGEGAAGIEECLRGVAAELTSALTG